VSIVATGMHTAVMLRLMRNFVGLVDRQGIHVRAQSDRGTVAGSENANHTGLAKLR
jgi:hypothetical protein